MTRVVRPRPALGVRSEDRIMSAETDDVRYTRYLRRAFWFILAARTLTAPSLESALPVREAIRPAAASALPVREATRPAAASALPAREPIRSALDSVGSAFAAASAAPVATECPPAVRSACRGPPRRHAAPADRYPGAGGAHRAPQDHRPGSRRGRAV